MSRSFLFLIYDLSSNEQLEDLSMYSYETILKGLLGIESKFTILDGLIKELAKQFESQKLIGILFLT